MPGDVGGWVSTFAKDFLASFDAENREDFVNDVIEYCKPKLMQADGTWVADYVRLRFLGGQAGYALRGLWNMD